MSLKCEPSSEPLFNNLFAILPSLLDSYSWAALPVVEGYLAHEKTHSPRSLPWAYA